MEWSSVRIPTDLKEQVKKIIERIPYWTSPDEFVRDAVREKISTVNDKKEEAGSS